MRGGRASQVRTVEVGVSGRGRLPLGVSRFPKSELQVDEEPRWIPPRRVAMPGAAVAISAKHEYRDLAFGATGRLIALEPRMRRVRIAVVLFGADGEPIHTEEQSCDLDWGSDVFQLGARMPVGRWALAHEVAVHLGLDLREVTPALVLSVDDIPVPTEG